MSRADLKAILQRDILRLQGFKSLGKSDNDLGLGSLNDAFPDHTFPLGAIHEFLSPNAEGFSATGGFVAGLLSTIMGTNGVAVWISACRNVFAQALKSYGVQPDKVIFIDVRKERDAIWVMEEALKCNALAAVVGELDELSFLASRRLQLAVENSRVTGFILRRNCRKLNTTACVSRWKITSLPSLPIEDLPGIGFQRWKVELMRMRNGKTGTWDISWIKERFEIAQAVSSDNANAPYSHISPPETLEKTG